MLESYTMRFSILPTFLLAIAMLMPGLGCRQGGETAVATTEAGDPAAAPADPLAAFSGDAKRWLRQVVGAPIEGHEIPVGSSARFVYDEIVVRPEGTWAAQATMHLAGERFGCEESGTWSDVEALSGDEGRITLALEQTDCVSRSSGGTQRLQIRYGDSSPVILAL